MKLKRKLILFFIIVLIFTTGCESFGNQPIELKDSIEINLWHYYLGENKKGIELAVKEFNQTVGLEKGIVVHAQSKGSIIGLEQAVTNAANGLIDSEEMPDIFSTYPDKAVEFWDQGIITELNPYISKEEQAEYVVSFLEDGIVSDDNLLIMPIAKSTELLYVNATDFDAMVEQNVFGYEDLKNWEGIYSAAKSYYEYTDAQTPEILGDGKSLMAIDSIANFVVMSTVQLNNAIVDTHKKQAHLDRLTLKKIFYNFYKGYVLGYYTKLGGLKPDDIQSGRALAFVGSSSNVIYLPTWVEDGREIKDIEYTILDYPTFRGGKRLAIRQGAGMCIAKSTPERQAAAVEFLKWFTEVENNAEFINETGYLPVKASAYTDIIQRYINSNPDGNQVKENVVMVYAMAKKKLRGDGTYAVKPFVGSHSIRKIAGETLAGIAEDGLKIATELRSQGKTEDEILRALEVDRQFGTWSRRLHAELKAAGVAYYDKE